MMATTGTRSFFDRDYLPAFERDQVGDAFAIDDGVLPFAFEHLKRCTFRELNFGETADVATGQKIAGERRHGHGFRICRSCGKVQDRDQLRWRQRTSQNVASICLVVQEAEFGRRRDLRIGGLSVSGVFVRGDSVLASACVIGRRGCGEVDARCDRFGLAPALQRQGGPSPIIACRDQRRAAHPTIPIPLRHGPRRDRLSEAIGIPAR